MEANWTTGKILFSSPSQAALFEHELKGQFSDGMWENSRPYDHWEFWCGLSVGVAAAGTNARVETNHAWRIKKTSYAVSKLYEIVGYRMLAIGRMTRALVRVGLALETFEHGALGGTAEYMPPTLDEWTRAKESGAWQCDFIAGYMERVTPELAAAFYASTYTMTDLRKDVAGIKQAMKNVVSFDARLA
jgi:hypothetical protein